MRVRGGNSSKQLHRCQVRGSAGHRERGITVLEYNLPVHAFPWLAYGPFLFRCLARRWARIKRNHLRHPLPLYSVITPL
jgi:hypothetical protein